MAVINKYNFLVEEVIVPTTLAASDTVKVDLQKQSVLVVENATGGSLTVNVIGDTATTTVCSGLGEIVLTGGKDFIVADVTTLKIPLNSTYQKWWGDGNLTITGGLNATAYILEV